MDDEPIFPGMTERELSIRRRVHRLAEFYRHLFVYVIVNMALWSVNAWQIYSATSTAKWYFWWAIWPTLGWGIGVFFHGLSVLPFWTFFSQEWEDKKVRQIMQREQQ